LIDRKLVFDAGKNQIVQTESGERFYFSLDERGADGAAWSAKSDDPDVEVEVKHTHPPTEASVSIRIHRGFNGPSTVYFVRKRPGAREIAGKFAMSFFKRTNDAALWE
jgi:hypothetical protein